VRIALDASYSVDPHPSGIGIYSRKILEGLALAFPQDTFVHCYRPKQFSQAPKAINAPNVRRRLMLPAVPSHPWIRANVFHALNQRVDSRPAKKIVTTFNDLFVMTGDYSSPEFRARFTRQAGRAAQSSDMIIAVSEFTAAQVSNLLGVERARIRVVPHGVNYPEATPSQAQREKLVLSVGAIQIRKNTVRLVEAFEAMPQDWRLVLAGSAGGYGADAIRAQIEKSSCRNRIQITGYIGHGDLEALYSRASIFAFPSLDEGFGIPVLEAMAHGLAVITSNCSALSEVAGQAARLVDPKQTEEVASALLELGADSQERTRLANLGRIRALEFPWTRAVQSTYDVYRELA
jgi:glycosyltransferase involved in cell wall biosynthesis